jgi:hypothetical protein
MEQINNFAYLKKIYDSKLKNNLEYWINRYKECCPPYTYPPELWLEVFEHKKYGWWIFKKIRIIRKRICARCGEKIGDGHMCKDISEYNKRNANGKNNN